MRMRQRYLWLAFAGASVAIGLGVLLGSMHSVRAQGTGLTVMFLVPSGTPITMGAT
jgi:hypothetical protein